MKTYIKFGILGIIIVLGIVFYPNLTANANVEALRSIIEPYGILAPAIFALIYIVSGIFFLPLTVFSVAGGVLFGTFGGLITVLISATLVGAFAFLIARQFNKYIPKAKAGVIYKLENTIEKQLDQSTFQTTMVLRLLYMPYIALSYATGLVKTAKFWPYLGATFLTNIAGSFVFVYLGDQLDKGLTALIIPLVLIALTLLIPKIAKRLIKQ